MHRKRPKGKGNQTYLKLINQRDNLHFKVDEIYPLTNLTTIGRSIRNDIILGAPFISNEHARIRFETANYLIEDLGSKNGTYVNGVKINEPVALKNGDKISLSHLEFIFVLDSK